VLGAVNRCAILLGVVAVLAAATAFAQDRSRYLKFVAEQERYFALSARAAQLAPRRRDAPMREANITDQEVREIQAAALDVVPRAIVNIGAVTTGCPCEDGPSCTDQVWIVATDSSRSKGLLLSRILGSWAVGPVQTWWLRYDDLLKRRAEFKDYRKFDALQQKLLDDMPFCSGAGADAEPAKPLKASQR
jgi:hypothetical protein